MPDDSFKKFVPGQFCALPELRVRVLFITGKLLAVNCE
jgi:hypothetical protein